MLPPDPGGEARGSCLEAPDTEEDGGAPPVFVFGIKNTVFCILSSETYLLEYKSAFLINCKLYMSDIEMCISLS